MWPGVSTAAQQAMRQSHGITIRAIAYGPYGTQEIPVGGGSATCDAGSQIRRKATLMTDVRMWPADPRSILAPYGTEIQVDYGIVLPSRLIEWIPIIRGRITETSRETPIPSDGLMPLQLEDRAARVIDTRFGAPAQTVSGALTTTEIRRLIQDAIPGVTVTDLTGSVRVAPVLDMEKERWSEGVEALAKSIGAEVYFNPQGSGVIRTVPSLSDPAVWVVSTGDTGILVSKAEKRSRDGVYNGVQARGERSDGTPPVQATVWDTNPNSPTYYLGSFGQRLKFMTSQLLTTTGQCTTAATAELARSTGLSSSVSMTTLVNPALEAGDVVELFDYEEGIRQVHIIDKLTIPFTADAAQPLETRSLPPTPL